MAEKDNKQDKQKKQEKKPAHEILLWRIKYHYRSDADSTQIILSELGEVLNTMLIPADRIPEIRRQLMNIFTSTSPAEIPVKNIDAFRCLVAQFQGEYPEEENR